MYLNDYLFLVALFELPQRNLSFNEDIIAFTQNKCKRLLTETRQKMFELSFFLIKNEFSFCE